jgi:hypothetical protein
MTAEDYGLARRMWHQLEPVHAVFWYAPEVFAEAAALGYEQPLGADRAQRLAELTGPLLGAAFESGLLPLQSTLGIAAVPAPAPHP